MRSVLASLLAVAATALAVAVPGTALAASAGDLDPAFPVFTAGPAAAAVDVAPTPDGGAVVLTESWRVVRLGPGGALLETFGEGGVADVGFSSGLPGPAETIAVDGDGRIVVGGEHDSQPMVARLMPDGTDDEGFGTEGRAIALFGPGVARAVTRIAFDEYGRLVLLGRTGNGGGSDVVVARMHVDGAADTTFALGDGRYVLNIGDTDEPGGLAVDPYGRILISGWRSGNVGFTMRFTEMGVPDPSYVPGGRREHLFADTTAVRLRDLALLPDDRIAVVGDAELEGETGTDGIMLLLSPDGELDDGFGDGVGTGSVNGDGRRLLAGEGDQALRRVTALPGGDVVVALERGGHVDLRRVAPSGFDRGDFGVATLPGLTAVGGLRATADGVLFSGAGAGGVGIVAGRVLLEDADEQPGPVGGGTGSSGGNGGTSSGGDPSSDASTDPFPSERPPVPPVGGQGGGVIVVPQPPTPPRAVATFDDRLRERRSGYRLTGRARGENGVRRVEVAILQRDGGATCRRVLDRALRWSAPGSCARRTWITASGTTPSWSLSFRRGGGLPPGRYLLYVRAVDRGGAGPVQRATLEVVRRHPAPWVIQTAG